MLLEYMERYMYVDVYVLQLYVKFCNHTSTRTSTQTASLSLSLSLVLIMVLSHMVDAVVIIYIL